LGLLAKLPLYVLFRSVEKPIILPFNYTFSITYKCNSRCKTCNIWKLQKVFKNELTTEEWISVLKSLGKSPFWITISGGEPFLRNDLEVIVEAISEYNDPAILNIPTNGLVKTISKNVEKILKICNNTTVVINFSLDGIGDEHDHIRGVKGNWKRSLENYEEVKDLKDRYDNLVVGIHTVISKWNVRRVQDIAKFMIEELKPDQYITEIAEIRREMDNIESAPTPDPLDYARAIDYVINIIEENMKIGKWKKLARFTEAFRIEYYKYVRDLYLGKPVRLKSYAGFASCQISPIGDVWECAVYATSMGNLRDFDYNFKKLWKSQKAEDVRKRVKTNHICPLANENYVNMLFSPITLLRVIKNIIFI